MLAFKKANPSQKKILKIKEGPDKFMKTKDRV